ncbi:MAG TPA: alpha/beta hydrolase [Solirubrobacterales bacterium]|nr:alpha/beta hydrolase [Solirubrobacterales bacterium]
MAGPISETTIDVDGVEVFVRRTGGTGAPTVFAHGNPTHSGQWVPFLERVERPGIAIDMPGFGRSARPSPRRFDYSMHGQARFFGRALNRLGVERYALVVQDWGGLALIDAIGHPGRVDRLVLIDAVPLLPGYRWHWIARYFWRVPGLGEFFNLATTKPALRLISRQSNARPGPVPEEFIDMVWEPWRRRRSAWRPMLRLYRSADPEALAAAGAGLGDLDCPALVVWGAHDPYIPVRFGRMYAERLPNAELVELSDAGHWPWIDRPDVIDRVARFVDGG